MACVTEITCVKSCNNNVFLNKRNLEKKTSNWKEIASCEEEKPFFTGKISDRLRFIVRNRTAITKTVTFLPSFLHYDDIQEVNFRDSPLELPSIQNTHENFIVKKDHLKHIGRGKSHPFPEQYKVSRSKTSQSRSEPIFLQQSDDKTITVAKSKRKKRDEHNKNVLSQPLIYVQNSQSSEETSQSFDISSVFDTLKERPQKRIKTDHSRSPIIIIDNNNNNNNNNNRVIDIECEVSNNIVEKSRQEVLQKTVDLESANFGQNSSMICANSSNHNNNNPAASVSNQAFTENQTNLSLYSTQYVLRNEGGQKKSDSTTSEKSILFCEETLSSVSKETSSSQMTAKCDNTKKSGNNDYDVIILCDSASCEKHTEKTSVSQRVFPSDSDITIHCHRRHSHQSASESVAEYLSTSQINICSTKHSWKSLSQSQRCNNSNRVDDKNNDNADSLGLDANENETQQSSSTTTHTSNSVEKESLYFCGLDHDDNYKQNLRILMGDDYDSLSSDDENLQKLKQAVAQT
jgi:hypothetical protein